MNDDLSHIIFECWGYLAQNDSGPQYVTVCNFAQEYINAYTVVLREVKKQEHEVIFYTDARSNKVPQIKDDSRITVINYNHENKVQLILRGCATVHHQNKTAKNYWLQSGYKGRRSYMAQPGPSSVIDKPADGLEYLNGKKFDDNDETGIENFAVIEVVVNQLEYLQLSREGNRRAKFTLENNEWKGSWLIP